MIKKESENKVRVCCGRKGCPTVEKLEDGRFLVTDDDGNKVKMDIDQAKLLLKMKALKAKKQGKMSDDINVDEANESPEQRLKALGDLYKNTMDTIKRTENIMYMTPPGANRDYYEMEIGQMQKHAEKIKKDYQALEAGMKGADNIRAQVSSASAESVEEAEYQGRKVSLGKPTRGDVKKFKVYVKNPKGNVVKVNFGDPNMKIKKSNPARRRSFRARHNCANPGPRHKARYWSCRKW